MKDKKILLVTTVPDTFISILRGQPGYLNSFFDVSIVSSDDGRLADFCKQERVNFYSVPMVRRISLFHDTFSIIKMVILLFNVRPDIVHSYTPKAGLVSMVAGWICKIPVRIHTFTGLIFPTQAGFKKQILLWVDRLICFFATKIIPEGEGVKKDLQNFSVTRKTLEIVGFGNIAGIDTSYFSPFSKDLKNSADSPVSTFDLKGFVFCFVGRLNRDKGIKELIQAFVDLPESSSLLLVGGDDDSAPVDSETKRLIENHPRVHVMGFQEDIRPALECSDVLVLPSYREGFPNVVLQAGAMALPVIATDINGCNEVIEPGYNGWLVPAKNSKALQQAMICAMELPLHELTIMGERARERIKAQFERDAHWLRMVSFYIRLWN